ncbi:hypothetical protein DQ04_06211020 [Trypanosoma grayi]|uniref:hypothetical protein n=1 Tax=Trypanosoma grayi TaxID=71804 RepID=UPI0004F46170|nr:hypothetical protein DQ04_06211020 [Trypanosoma grayi]KEG08903.1 hypothetical protein DQ04_06211020 [Trypanosoma grayi]
MSGVDTHPLEGDVHNTSTGNVVKRKKVTVAQQQQSKQQRPQKRKQQEHNGKGLPHDGPVGALTSRDVNGQGSKALLSSSGKQQRPHGTDENGVGELPPDLQDGRGGNHSAPPRPNPFNLLCAETVMSIGSLMSSEEGERKNNGEVSGHASIHVVAGSEKGSKKCLPLKISSPPCLSPKQTPCPGEFQPHTEREQGKQSHRQKEKEPPPEDEMSVFRGLAALDGNTNSVDYEGWVDESVMVCPFRLMGSCVKGHHTQRELLSNYTIHSHLMSLAGLVHELRTEQRISQKECQQLHIKLEAQNAVIGRLEKSLAASSAASGSAAPGTPSPPANLSSTVVGEAPTKSGDVHPTDGALSSRSILKTAVGGLTPVAADLQGNDPGTDGTSYAQRLRHRTSFATLAFIEGETKAKSTPTAIAVTIKAGGGACESTSRGTGDERHVVAKHLAEEVLTPVDLTRGVLDSSQGNASRTSRRPSEGHHRHHHQQQQKQKQNQQQGQEQEYGSPKHREESRNTQKVRCEGATEVVDYSHVDIVSPIASAEGSQDDDVSSNEDVMLMVTSRAHPSGDAALLPALGERRTGSSRTVLPQRPKDRSNVSVETSPQETLRRRFHSMGSNIAKTGDIITVAQLGKQWQQRKPSTQRGSTAWEETHAGGEGGGGGAKGVVPRPTPPQMKRGTSLRRESSRHDAKQPSGSRQGGCKS